MAVEGVSGVVLLSMDASSGQLSLEQTLSLPEGSLPATLACDRDGRVWAAGLTRSSTGASRLLTLVLVASVTRQLQLSQHRGCCEQSDSQLRYSRSCRPDSRWCAGEASAVLACWQPSTGAEGVEHWQPCETSSLQPHLSAALQAHSHQQAAPGKAVPQVCLLTLCSAAGCPVMVLLQDGPAVQQPASLCQPCHGGRAAAEACRLCRWTRT